MLRVALVSFSIALIQNVSAQSGIVSSGGNVSNHSGTVNYSIGQIGYVFFSNGNTSVTPGLQQSFKNSAASEPDNNISLYPNPALGEFVTLKVNVKDLTDYSYQLFNLEGKLLTKESLQGKETVIGITGLSAAVYLILVLHQNKPVKTFEIVKE